MSQNPAVGTQHGSSIGWRGGLLTFAGAVLIAVVWSSVHQADDPDVSMTRAPRIASCNFPNAYRASYRLDCSSRASGAVAQSIEVHGSLIWDSSPGAAGSSLVRVALRPDARSSQTLGPAEVVIEQLSDCSIARIAISSAWPAASSALLAQLLGNMQFTLAGTTLAGPWRARHKDDLGDYIAEYSTSSLGIRRQKLQYLSGPGSGPIPRITHSQLDVAPDPQGRWALSAVLKQTVQHPSPFPALVKDITAALDIRLERQVVEPIEGLQVATGLPEGYGWALEPFRMPNPPPEVARPTTAANADETLQALRDMHGKGAADREQIDFLVAWLRGSPGGAQALYAMLRAGALSDSEAAMAWLALRLADTKECIAVLRKACEDRELAGKERVRALWALSDATVAPESADALLRVASEQSGDPNVAHAALRASGHLSKRLGPGDPEIKQIIHSIIMKSLSSAATDDDRLASLDAVFNAEDQGLSAGITNELSNETPAVRAHAVEALAIALDDRAEAAALVAAADLNLQVRHSAAKALQLLGLQGHLSPTTAVSIGARLAVEGDAAVRLGLVAALGAAAAASPSAKQQLVTHYKREPDVQVLVQIGRFCTANDLK